MIIVHSVVTLCQWKKNESTTIDGMTRIEISKSKSKTKKQKHTTNENIIKMKTIEELEHRTNVRAFYNPCCIH